MSAILIGVLMTLGVVTAILVVIDSILMRQQ